jgi:hypothetical protein
MPTTAVEGSFLSFDYYEGDIVGVQHSQLNKHPILEYC